MKRKFARQASNFLPAMLLCTLCLPVHSAGADDWSEQDMEGGAGKIFVREMTLYPQAEPDPPLRYRLIPDHFDRKSGNAALYYLRAMGFVEQSAARDRVSEFQKQQVEKAREAGIDFADVPPNSWLSMPPSELPLDEVNEYLTYTSFQPRDLATARMLKDFEMDRNVRDVENPIMVLLPEIQYMRELARNQSLRCRVAIAESRAADAIEILGQQYSMANHLGNDEFIVSNLVGAAIAGIAFTDLLYLLESPEAPNLYWALAALPDPLIDMKEAMAYERQFLLEQVKVLREVDETIRPAGYWVDFVDRLLPQIQGLGADGFVVGSGGNTPRDRVALVTLIAASYPGAKKFLMERRGFSEEQIESYPVAQVVFLAQKKFYELATDEIYKWEFVDYAEAQASPLFSKSENFLKQATEQYGWTTEMASVFLGATNAIVTARERPQLHTSMAQTIEAIRMHASENDGQFPESLEALALPSPKNPYTGKPLGYQLQDGVATLTGEGDRLTYKLILKIAN
jgi:hypothetical protein